MQIYLIKKYNINVNIIIITLLYHYIRQTIYVNTKTTKAQTFRPVAHHIPRGPILIILAFNLNLNLTAQQHS